MQEGLAYSLNSPKDGGRANENNVAVPIGINGSELGYALRANASHSGDKGDGGVNTTLVAFPSCLSNQSVSTENLAPTMESKNPTAIAFDTAQITSKANGSRAEAGLPTPPLNQSAQMHVAIPINMQCATEKSAKRTDSSANHGFGIGQDGDPAPTLGANDRHAVAHSLTASGFDASEDGTGRGTPLVAAPLTAGMAESGSRMPHEQGALIPSVMAHGQANAECVQDGSPTLNCNHEAPILFQQMAVRRLTPKECARLQGFPDNYLDIEFRGKPACDGHKYRALGNSMAVPVMNWIGSQIELVASIKNKS